MPPSSGFRLRCFPPVFRSTPPPSRWDMASRTPRRCAACSRPWRESAAASWPGVPNGARAGEDRVGAGDNGPRAGGRKTHQPRSGFRDGMHIDWDVQITMDDGLVLRADVYRPAKVGKYPVILSYGPYAKGLAFQEGYPSAWQRMAQKHPDRSE